MFFFIKLIFIHLIFNIFKRYNQYVYKASDGSEYKLNGKVIFIKCI